MRQLKCYCALLLAVFIALLVDITSPIQAQAPAPSGKYDEPALTYVLVIDNSMSLRSQLSTVIDAGKLLVNTQRRADEACLVRFAASDKISVVQDFTNDKRALNDALNRLYAEFGGSAILDAVDFAFKRLAQHRLSDGESRRSAVVLVTDGDERNSYYKLETLLQHVRGNNVPIYVIGFTGELERQAKKAQATRLLDTLAQETGGYAYYPGSSSDLERIADTIMAGLHRPL